MDDDFRSTMQRTLDAVRAGDLTGATRIVQAKLSPKGRAATESAFADAPPAPLGDDAALPPPAGARPAPAGTPPGEDSPFQALFDKLRGGFSGLTDCAGAVLPGMGSGAAEATPVPAGATWTARQFQGAQGTRDYRLFIPSRGAEKATGLLLMLHGCKQDPEDFARGTGMLAVAEEEGLILAFPAQPRIANMSGCWNWFEPGHQRPEAGEPAILSGIVRELAAEFGIPKGRIFAAGLSAGGAMAAILADAEPELFDAIGVHSGLPAGAAHDVASAFAAMGGRQAGGRAALRDGGPRLIVFHGDADDTVAVGNADRLLGSDRKSVV